MAFLDKLGELARTAADKANDGLEINRTVSYTHLDVYKRQKKERIHILSFFI